MSIPKFQLNTIGNAYYDTFGTYENQYGYASARATRHASVGNHNTLAKTIAANHASEFKEAFEYIEDGNINAFKDTIAKIQTSEASKQRTYNITDAEIASAIEDAYQQVVGADYDTSIISTKMSSRQAGFDSNFFGGIFAGDTKSAAEYVAERKGTTVNANEQNEKLLGSIGGTVATAGTLAAAVGIPLIGITGGAAAFASIGAAIISGPVGWCALGLGVAAAIALGTKALNKA